MQTDDPRPWREGPTETPALAPLLQPFSPLALHVHRSAGEVVGRPAELHAIGQELSSARAGRLVGLTVEGEPGIGKTRLLLAASELATEAGFTTIAVTADEELRGPFLLARSILGSTEAVEAVAGSPDEETLGRCLDSMSGQDDPSLATLSPDQRVLRTLDLGAVAIKTLASRTPLALLIDDLQWSDDDSLRLLRYVVRAAATSPIFLMAAIRPEELAFVTEAVNLLADMERLGLVRRLKLDRFTQSETRELLEQVLGAKVNPASAAAMHAQAEGVPFIVEEMAQAYRDGGMIQQIDGVWALARNADRLVPSAVRTLISRRAARLPEATKASLAEAAVLGRHFSLKDLREIEARVGRSSGDPDALAEALAPAVAAGLLVERGEDAAADYSFPHEQIREFAAAELTATQRRAIHAAIVQLLLAGEPSPESLPLLAHHAKAAGDGAVCVRFSLEASRNALSAHAPEEVLRVVELALPSAATPQQRVELLEARDAALGMLRRPSDRMEGLAELAALAEALGDSRLELDVRLRRAATLRAEEEAERAAELAREVRELAASRGDRENELAACMELGQDLLGAPVGESFLPAAREVDFDAAEEPFRRAAELGRELGDEAAVATALRELGVIALGRVREWFVDRVEAGEHIEIARRVASGEVLDDIVLELPIAPTVEEASRLFEEALEMFEKVGDRRGAMSAIIAMGYLSWAADIHMGSGAARHIEEIRRLTSRMSAFTNESERAALEAQMLYGVHVFARAKVIPDLAISKAEEAYRHAKEIGDRSLEFLSAGGGALGYLDLGEVEEAKRWLDRAAATAAESPTPLRARRLETWRGLAYGRDGNVDGMRRHLERAVELAVETGKPAARSEALSTLALEASRLGVEREATGVETVSTDHDLLEVAERAAKETAELIPSLPGHPPWGAQADAALARVALARGRPEEAAEHARSAMASLDSAKREDLHLDIVLPAADVLFATGAPEWESLRPFLQLSLAMIAQRTLDENVRVRWFRGPIGREMTRLSGPLESATAANATGGADLAGPDAELLRSLIQGRTNREIAEELGIDEQAVTRRLAELFATIGATSRAEATAFAFRQRVV
jgi:tetratricopeptide (TPR) repeat protein/DNA-binding CsgD family transcriptional regulator